MTNATIKFNYNGTDIELPISVEPQQLQSLIVSAGIEGRRTGYERVVKGDTYYYLTEGMGVESAKELQDMDDNYRESAGNYFSNEETALYMALYVETYLKIRAYAARKGYLVPKEQWCDSHIAKFCIRWNGQDGMLFVSAINFADIFGALYFNSFNAAADVMQKFYNDILEIMESRETLEHEKYEREVDEAEFFKE